MSTAYVVVSVVAAVMAGFSAASVLLGAEWVLKPLADYGVPRAWGPWLGAAKAAGAVGLLAGGFVPGWAWPPRPASTPSVGRRLPPAAYALVGPPAPACGAAPRPPAALRRIRPPASRPPAPSGVLGLSPP
jgi:hypothetical protein